MTHHSFIWHSRGSRLSYFDQVIHNRGDDHPLSRIQEQQEFTIQLFSQISTGFSQYLWCMALNVCNVCVYTCVCIFYINLYIFTCICTWLVKCMYLCKCYNSRVSNMSIFLWTIILLWAIFFFISLTSPFLTAVCVIRITSLKFEYFHSINPILYEHFATVCDNKCV